MMIRPATPPITPPTIAPTEVLDDDEDGDGGCTTAMLPGGIDKVPTCVPLEAATEVNLQRGDYESRCARDNSDEGHYIEAAFSSSSGNYDRKPDASRYASGQLTFECVPHSSCVECGHACRQCGGIGREDGERCGYAERSTESTC